MKLMAMGYMQFKHFI